MAKRLIIPIILSVLIIIGAVFFSYYFLRQKNSAAVNLNLAQNYNAPVIVENNQAKVPILIYHHIREHSLTNQTADDKTFTVTPKNFDEQIKYLKDNNYTPILVTDLANFFAGKSSLSVKPVIIVFDDGNIDQYTNALPILKKYNFMVTFYIFTNPIGKSVNYLTWDQVKELDSLGMEIGSHTRYHHYLTKETNPAELDKEIAGSKKTIEDKLGHEIFALSYPFGKYTDAIIAQVKAAGYTSGRDIVNGTDQTKENVFKLRAYFVTDDFARFARIVK